MKKAFYLSVVLILFQTTVFCQSTLYSYGIKDDPPAIFTRKINQTTCSYDTISISSSIDGCNISAFYGRGVTSTCDYFIFGYWCPPNDSTILFLGLNQDTAFTINYAFPLRFNIEVEYNPSDNCLYILSPISTQPNSIGVYKCSLTTGMTNLLTTLPSEYSYGYYGFEAFFSMCDIDIDSNFMYCGSPNKIAKINLTNGVTDTLYPYLDDSTMFFHNYGLFFDQERRLIISISTDSNYTMEPHGYLISYNPATNEKNIIGNLFSPFGFNSLAYNDENDIYTIDRGDNKFYFYNSLNGALIDSCSIINNQGYHCFYSKCNNSIGIEEKSQPPNIKLYPTIADDCLFFEFEKSTKEVVYNIFDNMGRVISSGQEVNNNSNLVKIKLPKLVPGYYYIQVRTEKALKSFMFFIL